MKVKTKKSQKDIKRQAGDISTSQSKVGRSALLKAPYPYLVIAGLILIVYAQTFSFGFTEFDDVRLVRDNFSNLKPLPGIMDILQRDVFLSKEAAIFYRPVQVISYVVDTVIGGAHARSYHVSNVLLHCMASCSLLYFLFLLGFRNLTALLLVALYAVHPVFVQSVCWIPSRGDLLIALFVLWTMICYLRYAAGGRTVYLILHGVFYLVAVLSKETAVVLPILLLAGSYIFYPEAAGRKKLLPSALIWAAVFCLWFFLRSNVVSANDAAQLSGIGQLIRNLPAIPVFISKFFIPLALAPIPSFTLQSVVIGILLILVLIVLAFLTGKQRDPHFLFGALWFMVFVGPGLWLRPALGGNAYDYLIHRLYLPAVGLVISIAVLLQLERPVARKWIMSMGIFAVIAGGIYAHSLAPYYEDPQSFYDFAVSMNPESALARSNRGAIYRDQGRTKEALADFDEALRIRPDFPEAHYNRGTVNMSEGNPGAAENDFTQVIALDPKHLQARNSRGAARGMLGNLRGALEDFDQAILLNPRFAESYFNRGMAKRKLEDVEGAISDYSLAIRCNPAYADAYMNRGMAKGSIGEYRGAIADLTEVLRYKPDEAIAYRNRGIARLKLSDSTGAREDWTKAAQRKDQLAAQLLRQNFQ
jgi:protein O-mannosyl-transferase